VPHEAGAAGVGGRHLIAGQESIADASLAVPLAAGLAGERVDDVQARLQDQPQVGKHVREADHVVVVGAHPPRRQRHRRQAE